METNSNTSIETEIGTEVENGVSSKDGATKETKETMLTLSQKDYDRAIQSAEDKVRGKLSKEIRDLQEELKKLKPVEKTEAELELEKRIAALEESERTVAEQKKKLDLQEALSERGINKSLVDFVKEDVDIEAFSNLLNEIVKEKMKSNGFVPGTHSSDDKISPEEFRKMSYSQKVELQKKSPELFERLMAKR